MSVDNFSQNYPELNLHINKNILTNQLFNKIKDFIHDDRMYYTLATDIIQFCYKLSHEQLTVILDQNNAKKIMAVLLINQYFCNDIVNLVTHVSMDPLSFDELVIVHSRIDVLQLY